MRDKDEAVLAGAAGAYREALPALPLKDHFLCAWSHQVAPDHCGPMAIVPDGCVDIVWLAGRLHVAGPDIEVALPEPPPGAGIVGMRFAPGAAARWLGLPMSELVGRQVALTDLWGGRARDLTNRVGDAETVERRLTALQSGLATLAPAIEAPARDMAFVFDRLSRGPASLEALRDRLDISERTLRRRSREAFGYGPKTLERILRFQRFLRLARQMPETGLATLGAAAGYSDQAHLGREVRSLSGLTPVAVLKQLEG
ncbi:helix-turn-helix domain-containing protein [Phreatobacter stygius]|uniref:AraC family transcriptional regulator n=1 Tax=Phreatobacter stygius TaxID=1940610 RepID=A0A4D7AZY6_9HYPH|nr:helix-turn-helix domain-containing protein [Phreatobacter stygius]QCI66919.1 AraC family transcriptional regulator [Phreatobacter stygius]